MGTSPVQVPAGVIARTGTIHVDDAAAAFHAVIDRLDGRLGSWPVFDLVTEILSAVESWRQPKWPWELPRLWSIRGHCNPFLEALSLVSKANASQANASRAKTVSQPKRTEFLLNHPIFFSRPGRLRSNKTFPSSRSILSGLKELKSGHP